MRYGSVCSGIEAATVAWNPLGWEPAFFSEIEAFPRAVLQHHYPETPLHGDFTTIGADEYGAIDLLVGGTPCQSFSVAGLRKGLDDERGNLALEYLKLAQRKRPTWLVWENVPGVLSSNGGRDFGAFLGGLVELGYGFAYRVLDAQYFGVAQRRRRVFVVGYLGDWRPPAAVLFERHSMQGHPAPRREAGKGFAADVVPSLTASGRGVERAGETRGQDPVVAHTLRAQYDASEDGTGRGTPIVPTKQWPADIACTLDAKHAKHAGQDNQHIDGGASLFVLSSGQANAELSEELSPALNCNRDGAPIAFGWQNSASQGDSVSGSVIPTLDKSKTPAVAFTQNQRNELRTVEVPGAPSAQPGMKQQTYVAQGVTIHGTDKTARAASFTDTAGALRTKPPGSIENSSTTAALHDMAVRRLTPVECERLQGFPDNYTRIPYKKGALVSWARGDEILCPDGPRYKALGNSMAVPVMRWLGERIQKVDDLIATPANHRPADLAMSMEEARNVYRVARALDGVKMEQNKHEFSTNAFQQT